MGSHIFRISGIRKKILVSRDLKVGRFADKKLFVLFFKNKQSSRIEFRS